MSEWGYMFIYCSLSELVLQLPSHKTVTCSRLVKLKCCQLGVKQQSLIRLFCRFDYYHQDF